MVAQINLPIFQQPLGTSLETSGSRKEVHAVQNTVILRHIWPQCDYALPSDVAWEVWQSVRMGQNNGLLDLTSCCVRPRRFRSTLLGKVQAKNHDRKVAGPRRFREACWVLVGFRFSGMD